MNIYDTLKPEKVFHYFKEISAIPHGSGNMEKISEYCAKFARENSLKYEKDHFGNVIIYKPASDGYEKKEPVILQGHLDMVCQKTEERDIDFKRDGLKLYVDGDFLKAEGTTLGADNGIAVAMVLFILEDKTLCHPPIEAVFTADEEIGLIGAGKLGFDKLSAKKMINIDSEEQDVLTVSCAGGSDFCFHLPVVRETGVGKKATVFLRGLTGGHSGVEIHKWRVNGGVLAGRIIHALNKISPAQLLSVSGGDKANAIIPSAKIEFVVQDAQQFQKDFQSVIFTVTNEIAAREPSFAADVEVVGEGRYEVLSKKSVKDIVHLLLTVPNGVQDMSADIEDLVETSLNLGVLSTGETEIFAHYALRSNKSSSLEFLEEKLINIAKYNNWEYDTFGHYPPWEYRDNSSLQKIYTDTFKEEFGYEPTVTAIHAGLECGVFAANIKGIECISIGPDIFDVHTVNEKLSISSTKAIHELLIEVLKNL